jgi:RNA polymerase sigma factor (TIGR02999 family)
MPQTMSERPDVTALLLDLDAGDKSAFETLVTVMYDDLRRLARHHLRTRGNQLTLHTAGLVHEAFLKLADRTRLSWENRGHFLAVYARVMHNILIDMARERGALKRGGDRVRVTLDDRQLQVGVQAEDLLALEQALAHLGSLDPRLVQVVECRFFAGLEEEETALALGVTARTVRRDWVKARTILHRTLTAGTGESS